MDTAPASSLRLCKTFYRIPSWGKSHTSCRYLAAHESCVSGHGATSWHACGRRRTYTRWEPRLLVPCWSHTQPDRSVCGSWGSCRRHTGIWTQIWGWGWGPATQRTGPHWCCGTGCSVYQYQTAHPESSWPPTGGAWLFRGSIAPRWRDGRPWPGYRTQWAEGTYREPPLLPRGHGNRTESRGTSSSQL